MYQPTAHAAERAEARVPRGNSRALDATSRCLAPKNLSAMRRRKGTGTGEVDDRVGHSGAEQNHHNNAANATQHAAAAYVVARKGWKNAPRVRGMRHTLAGPA